MNEHDIQNTIRIEFSRHIPQGLLFRCNVGKGWTGSSIRKNPDGSITLYNPRPFDTGLPSGFADLLGVLPGGRALFIEVKNPTGKPTPEQVNFLRQVSGIGALAGIARSFEDVLKIINGS